MNEALCKDISNEEIKIAVFSLGAHKALGPDGFPGLFFHSFWNLIKKDVCAMVHDFFS
ncbi:hypothetical protein REPUB_Repub08aG0096000 [Reevesia pubescens]